MRYFVRAIPDSIVTTVRETLKAPGYGHPAFVDVARDYGPCRSCLQPFKEGIERRVLFTYDPFQGMEPFPLPGPIYVHASSCEPYGEAHRVPDALKFIPMTLNAYGQNRVLRTALRLAPYGSVEDELLRLLERDDVDYIHVRNTEAGCFMFQVERA